MNIKIITISLVAILGVAGGAYTLINSEMKLAQYIPESISKLWGGAAEKTTDFVDNTPTFVYEEEGQEQEVAENPVEQPAENSIQSSEQVEVMETQSLESSSPKPEDSVVEASNTSSDKQVYEEIAETVNKNMSSDEISISQQIEAADSEIYKLEAENKELEALFQKILRQNRALAEKLRELDEKIAALN
jgi:hypothetical protein